MIAAALALAATVWAREGANPPDVRLTVPPPFATSVSVFHYRKGADVLNVPQFQMLTIAPMTEYKGWFGPFRPRRPRIADYASDHTWNVRVYRHFSRKLTAAYATAKDGFEADLNEGPEFLDTPVRSYLFARFERKHFRWGDGLSFFSQSTQDTGLYVPHNGHLQYEVWGITPDHRFTVVASVFVSHSKLADWGPSVRDAPSIEALKRDRDYKRVEKCSADEFKPSLTAFDRMLDTLIIR